MKKLIILALLLTVPIVIEARYSFKNLTDYQCMVANIFFEARGETIQGMQAVAKVTMNRAKSNRYPSSICAVVFQRKQFSWTHQQSWKVINRIVTGQVNHLKGKDLQAYTIAQIIAHNAVTGKLLVPKLKDSMYYHATYVNPKWARKMQRVAKVGSHIFYKG